MDFLKAVVDRFEGDNAVLIVGDMQDRFIVDRGTLPLDVKEGDWLKVEVQNERIVRALLDAEETETVKRRINEKMTDLRRGNHLN